MFRFRFANEVLWIKWNCRRANSSSLVVGSSLRSCRFCEFVGIFAKELAEEFIFGRFLIIGRSALTFLLFPTFLRCFFSRRRFLWLFLFSCYQRFVLKNCVKSRDDKSRSINFFFHNFWFAKLLLDFFTQGENEFFVPLWPGFIPRSGFELLFSRNQFHLKIQTVSFFLIVNFDSFMMHLLSKLWSKNIRIRRE